jgi:hypothetical protein
MNNTEYIATHIMGYKLEPTKKICFEEVLTVNIGTEEVPLYTIFNPIDNVEDLKMVKMQVMQDERLWRYFISKLAIPENTNLKGEINLADLIETYEKYPSQVFCFTLVRCHKSLTQPTK